MSLIRFVVVDQQRALHGEIGVGLAQCIVASLSASPETIEELQCALTRFQGDLAESLLGALRDGLSHRPYDAGLIIIDLPGRLVAARCEGVEFMPCGMVSYRESDSRTMVASFTLSDDWLVIDQVENWPTIAQLRRAKRRQEEIELDFREHLFGDVMLDFVLQECHASDQVKQLVETNFASGWDTEDHDQELVDDSYEAKELEQVRAIRQYVRSVHARWLTEPREEFAGSSPRDWMLRNHDFLCRDLQDREEQWARSGRCPPGLDRSSNAYRFASFGMNQIVIYYDLFRYLCYVTVARFVDGYRQAYLRQPIDRAQGQHALEAVTSSEVPESEKRRLRRWLRELMNRWLDEPNEEYEMSTPRDVMERERQRIPEVVPVEKLVDCDCPLCKMMANAPGPTFWHLDGYHLDHDFAFSVYLDREQWSQEAEFLAEDPSDRFEDEDDEQSLDNDSRDSVKASGNQSMNDSGDPVGGYVDLDLPDLWNGPLSSPARSLARGTSVKRVSMTEQSTFVAQFQLGCDLSSLVQQLRHAECGSHWVDGLNRHFESLNHLLSRPELETESLAEARQEFVDYVEELDQERPALHEDCLKVVESLHGLADVLDSIRRKSNPPR